mmetsp:Transcript_23667/g.55198  ORF Transcript_23667/g.55198 Transcript_23667/m.55198 type:complete len:356 (-) Transcript_23667:125-1192(-)|eukprot:CAMPEP_0178447042 /NCGR_PEP_ID=MMETSP0689_2-20121128/41159_1 /TAXON_ID=160604 /ORGANISM="Amphidinium massartii, Strain CS-259" /LENGTH=355 /DNA_ID=CAMNT_0020071973 /DNA_START=66 /DNA_END=1133 /DNA_ORIENTATION=-
MDGDIVNKFLFPAPTASYSEDSFEGELVWVPLEPGMSGTDLDMKATGMWPSDYRHQTQESFPCLFLECGTSMYVLIYFHPNAEDLGRCRTFCWHLRELLDVHVLAVEYPGYGPHPCHPANAAQAKVYASAAFSFVVNVLRWPRDSILLFGSSIGTGLAMHLAAHERDVAGMVLVAPFLSIKRACSELYGAALAGLIHDPLPNDQYAVQIRTPTLIVHGKEDQVISCQQGMELFDILGSRKALVMPRNLGHNGNLFQDENMLLRPMLRFFPLPDYCFEHMHPPQWIFSRGSQDETIIEPETELSAEQCQRLPQCWSWRSRRGGPLEAQAKYKKGSAAALAEQKRLENVGKSRRMWL